MNQEQLIQEYLDDRERDLFEKLAEAAEEAAESVAERKGAEIHRWEIERPPNHLGPREPVRMMWCESRDPVVIQAVKDAVVARLKCIAYERWFLSNGTIARQTSEHVRSRKPDLTKISEHLAARLDSPDMMVRGTAYGELASG